MKPAPTRVTNYLLLSLPMAMLAGPIQAAQFSGGTNCATYGSGDTLQAEAKIIKVSQSNPYNPDWDGDGMTNTYEFTWGLDLEDASDAGLDLDGDGLKNLAEFQMNTDPKTANVSGAGNIANTEDLDGDGLNNGLESTLGTNPNKTDSDDDSVSDYVEVMTNATDPLDGIVPVPVDPPRFIFALEGNPTDAECMCYQTDKHFQLSSESLSTVGGQNLASLAISAKLAGQTVKIFYLPVSSAASCGDPANTTEEENITQAAALQIVPEA